MRFLSLLLIWLFFTMTAFAENGKIKFEHLSIEEGVSHNLIYTIMQDSRGFMWFGTMYGLAKYDGIQYTVYRHNASDSTSISFDDIISLHEDRYGKIWVGTWGGGLNQFDPASETFVRYLHDPENPASIAGNTVWKIAETTVGDETSLWFATNYDGLNRLVISGDAEPEFIHYRHDPENPKSLRTDYTGVVYTDQAGNLWVATGNGLSHLNFENGMHANFEHFQHDAENPNSLPANYIEAIHEDREKNIWVGTPAGLSFMDAEDRKSGKFSRHFMHQPDDPNSLVNSRVKFILEDQDETMWIGTRYGLSVLTSENRERGHFMNFRHDPADPYSLSSNSPIAICEDRSGILWIGTYYGGLDRVIKGKQKFAHIGYNPQNPTGLNRSLIRAVFEDHRSNIWIGTRGGLEKMTTASSEENSGLMSGPVFEDILHQPGSTNSLPSNRISAISETVHDGRSRLWIGSDGRGLTEMTETPGGRRTFRHFAADHQNPESLSNNFVTAILPDQRAEDPSLWVGTNNGLSRLPLDQIESGKFQRYFANPEDSTTMIHNWVLSLFEDSFGNLWVGSYGGLSKFDRQQNRFQNYMHALNDPASLSNNYVYALHESRHRGEPVLWVGTSGGLNRLSLSSSPEAANTSFVSFTEADGLPNSVICGILEDDAGNLWLSTHKGLSKFNPRENSFRNFDIADGLQSNVFNPGVFLKTASGEFFFGGINGFNQFHPSQISRNNHLPPVQITQITRFDTPLPFDRYTANPSALDLAYDENFITFEFAALDFTAPEKNHYAYQLEGVDKTWQYAGNENTATYTNLSPGNYTFHVKAANNDGLWNPEAAAIPVIIHPPFWQTAWFFAICTLLVGLAIFLVHHFRVKSRVRQSLLIERAKQKERDWVREKTARDYHDVLGHQLTKISLYSELIRRNFLPPAVSQAALENGDHGKNGISNGHGNCAANGNGHQKGSTYNDSQLGSQQVLDYLNKITTASGHLCTDTRDFIWSLNPEKDTLYETALHLKEFADELFEETDINVHVTGLSKALKDIKLSMDWRRHLTLIFKEGMNNILKHAQCQNVTLAFEMKEGRLQISLSDDGEGLPVKQSSSGNGLQNMKKRAQKINGSLTLLSSPHEGTTIQLISPAGPV